MSIDVIRRLHSKSPRPKVNECNGDFRQSSGTPCGKGRFYECQQAVVSARTTPLDEQVKAQTERCKQNTHHQSKLRIVCEMSSTSKVKRIQQYSDN
jgi:hypothetical protein